MKIFFCYFLRNNYSHNIIISKYTLFQIQNCGWRSVNFKMSFWRLQSSQKKQEYFVRISALASRKRSNQKSSVRESKKNQPISVIKCPYFFDLTSFYRLGQKSLEFFCWFLVNLKTPKEHFEINRQERRKCLIFFI